VNNLMFFLSVNSIPFERSHVIIGRCLFAIVDKQLNKNKEKIRYTNTDVINRKKKKTTYIQTTDIITFAST
jgi:hypothetical protein